MSEFLATLIDAPVRGHVRVRERALLSLGPDGAIAEILAPDDPDYVRRAASPAVRRFGPSDYLLPGFVDLHVHAPQWPQAGKALDKPLEEWLFTYTFPLEARFADSGFAERVYAHLVSTLLANGTTTAMYYASTHVPASVTLARICLAQGQRAYVGRVAMDCPEMTASFYRDADARAGIDASLEHILAVRALDAGGGLVFPVVTPRFIPSCTDALLEGLGRLAQDMDLHVQTHCSEGDWEHAFVIERMGDSDTRALDRLGLLKRGTVLAHANFLSDADKALIVARKAAIAHCPLANLFFSNAVMPVAEALDMGLSVGLGTDIAGGAKAGLFDAARYAMAAAAALNDGVDPALPPGQRGGRKGARYDWRTAFWMATAGGAHALGANTGVFDVGREFDAIRVAANRPDADLAVWEGLDGPDDAAQKILQTMERPNVREVWVRGRRVVSKD